MTVGRRREDFRPAGLRAITARQRTFIADRSLFFALYRPKVERVPCRRRPTQRSGSGAASSPRYAVRWLDPKYPTPFAPRDSLAGDRLNKEFRFGYRM
ncbi:hypothetical protein EVAR_45831_1 [Eumeta japonica]|uniref:Uncharacterized protein n=1 Tax=Eumeta variegata TaxID=151549 RepID=A0A4C1WN99_EUMVA|nr:hypothetical protein EVAR_45831_1 [Eumeta japonica]